MVDAYGVNRVDVKTDLRARLVGEAMRILAEHPADLTLRGVARAAGVSAMAPYRHFADKASLLRAVTETGFEMLRVALLEVDRTNDNRDALVGQGLAYIAFAVAHPALFRLMFAAPGYEKFAPDPQADTAYGVLARRMSRMVPDRPATATTAAWAIVHGLATLTLDARLPAEPDHARQALTLFVDGISTTQALNKTD
jgi:AcrR family transcriptional regulator